MEEERRFVLLGQVIEAALRLGQAIIAGIVLVCIAYFLQKVLLAYAGKTTEANLSFSLLARVQADRWVAYIFGAGGVTYGLFERNLRQSNIKRMSKLNSALEQKLDPNRTSSGLTPTGKTHKSDL